MDHYIHGYTDTETLRLSNQARTLAELLHHDSVFPAGSSVLEVGCGTGAQTVILAQKNPVTTITAIDISAESLAEASSAVQQAGFNNVVFQQADIFHLPLAKQSFDQVFVCFVLEHLSDPVRVLTLLKEFLKPGGKLTLIEGDHGSTCFYPDSDAARAALNCQVALQKLSGGNANIGRELYPLLKQAGFMNVRVSPRMVYVDAGRPELVEGFTKQTFTAMIEGIREKALQAGIISPEIFDQGVQDLYRTTWEDGVFCYTFFKAFGAMRCDRIWEPKTNKR